jgi:pyruvate dehydrogenase E2 component (dihydrolipoamide acetyltransferase)
MAQAIIMPKAGMAMETGKIIEWLKKPGDKVEVGEAILEIETDKVAMEVEAEISGVVLAITREAGEEVPVTETIGWIGAEGEQIPDGGSPAPDPGSAATRPASHAGTDPSSEAPSSAGSVTPAATGTSAPPTTEGAGRLKATPAARRLSGELGIPLESVTPGGPAGEIRAEDVRAAAGDAVGAARPPDAAGTTASPLARRTAEQAGLDLGPIEGSGPGARVTRRDVAEQGPVRAAMEAARAGGVEPSRTPAWTAPEDTETDLAGVRKIIAQRMTESHLMIPPVTLNAVADVSRLMVAREELNAHRLAAGDQKLSYNDFVLKATARALVEAPWMRVSLAQGKVITHGAVDLGMAVAAPAGLMVPVIRNAGRLSLSEIHKEARELARKARDRKLLPENLQGATFSVSNLGMYGITTFTPIVNPPEAAILGVGTIRRELRLDPNGNPQEHELCDLSLTVDHRLIDGAQGALFLQKLLGYLEAPLTMLA